MLTVGCIRVVNYQPPGLSIPKAQGLRDQYLRVLPCINGSPKASDFVQQRGLACCHMEVDISGAFVRMCRDLGGAGWAGASL